MGYERGRGEIPLMDGRSDGLGREVGGEKKRGWGRLGGDGKSHRAGVCRVRGSFLCGGDLG